MSFIKSDKLAHFLAGSSIVAFSLPFGFELALSLCALAAVGKEMWDHYNNGTPDVLDAVATLVGGVSLYAWYSFLLSIWR